MDQWKAETVFLITGLLSGLAGACAEARLHKTITKWEGMLASMFYGMLGAALGMFGYAFMGGKEHPEIILACGMLVGLRLIKIKRVRQIVERLIDAIFKFDDKGKKDDDDHTE